MKSTQLYDFTLAANGSQVILADANFYKVLTSTGDLKITRDGGSTVRPMRAGRGEREVDFQRLTVTDISGAPNSGTIVVGDSNFIDDTIVLSSAINIRPEPFSGSYKSTTALGAASSDVVFTAASNTGGTIVYTAEFLSVNAGTLPINSYVAKATAPASVIDGDVLALTTFSGTAGATHGAGRLASPVLVPAGKGLYYWNTAAETGALRSVLFKQL